MWICLVVVLWSSSSLHCQQSGSLANTNTNQPRQSSPHDNHHSWIGGGGLIQKKPQGSANWPECVEIGRSCRGITRSSLASYSLWSHGRQRYKANQHKSVLRVAEQGELMPQPPPPTVCGAIFIFFPPQNHAFSLSSASAKHPLTCVSFSTTSSDSRDSKETRNFHLSEWCSPSRNLRVLRVFEK